MRTSIVVPCYNEEARFQSDTFLSYLKGHPDVRFVLVDDGSRDRTVAVLNALRERSQSEIDVLELRPNRGKAEAVRAGMNFAIQQHAPSYVGFWDADLATPLSAIDSFTALLDVTPTISAVIGCRVKLLGRSIERKVVRHYLGRIFATAASITLQLPVYDTQCGAKIFRVTNAFRNAIQDKFESRWIFDVELLARLIAFSGREAVRDSVYEFPLKSWADVDGSSVKPADFLRAVTELLSIYRQYRIRQESVRVSSPVVP